MWRVRLPNRTRRRVAGFHTDRHRGTVHGLQELDSGKKRAGHHPQRTAKCSVVPHTRQDAASSNSPFLAPSRKQSHSNRVNSRTRPAGSPVTRISAHCCPPAQAKATSITPVPCPEGCHLSVSTEIPSCSGVGLAGIVT